MAVLPSGQPLIYLQIAQLLEDDILRGVYQEEEQVPSTNDLARSCSINPATAAKGINLLVAEGVLYKRRGIGMFVSPGAARLRSEERRVGKECNRAKLVRKKRQGEFYQKFVRPMAQEGKSLGLSGPELLDMVKQAVEEEENT